MKYIARLLKLELVTDPNQKDGQSLWLPRTTPPIAVDGWLFILGELHLWEALPTRNALTYLPSGEIKIERCGSSTAHPIGNLEGSKGLSSLSEPHIEIDLKANPVVNIESFILMTGEVRIRRASLEGVKRIHRWAQKKIGVANISWADLWSEPDHLSAVWYLITQERKDAILASSHHSIPPKPQWLFGLKILSDDSPTTIDVVSPSDEASDSLSNSTPRNPQVLETSQGGSKLFIG